MTQAARIMERVMKVAIDAVEPGTRQCDAAAEIYTPKSGHGGISAATTPPSCRCCPRASAPRRHHLTGRAKFVKGEPTILELAAARQRYHCPMARTVYLGKPPQKMADTASVVLDGIAAGLEAASRVRPARRWRLPGGAPSKHGIDKESRGGYSTGLNYPPDWGERTMSRGPDDKSVLEPNMTIHLMPASGWMTGASPFPRRSASPRQALRPSAIFRDSSS